MLRRPGLVSYNDMTAQPEQNIEAYLARAAVTIRSGDLVAFPTETVYGLGANALNAVAVAKIFEVKKRPFFDPLIVHVAGAEALRELVTQVPPTAATLIERFWPGPLSLVLPKQASVPDIVTSGLPSVAIRCPAHPLAQQLIRAAGVPLAAPSANLFGAVSPTTAAHVREQFGDRLPLILDGGPCRVGVESTVVSFLDEQPVLLRPGGVTVEDLETAIGKVQIFSGDSQHPVAPGQLARHYSPSTPLQLTCDTLPPQLPPRVGLLAFGPGESAGFAAIEVLSSQRCLREAAANLFAALRRLDALQLDLILAEPVPETGLGRAIMDRLRRAAARS